MEEDGALYVSIAQKRPNVMRIAIVRLVPAYILTRAFPFPDFHALAQIVFSRCSGYS